MELTASTGPRVQSASFTKCIREERTVGLTKLLWNMNELEIPVEVGRILSKLTGNLVTYGEFD